MSKSFDELISKVSKIEKKKVSVAVAQDNEVLLAVKAAKEQNIADAILVGDEDEIRKIAAEIGMDLTGFEIIDVKDKIEAARTAVKLVHSREASFPYRRCIYDLSNT